MNVNAVKHQAKLVEWKGRVADCRSSGMSVKHWCEENCAFSHDTYLLNFSVYFRIHQFLPLSVLPVALIEIH